MPEKMEVIYVEYSEVEEWLGQFLGLGEKYDNLPGDLCNHDFRWANDTQHVVTVAPDEYFDTGELTKVLDSKELEFGTELHTVMNEMARQGVIETGTYLINVCW